MAKTFRPKKSDKFAFGLWTVGNPGADPFGPATRKPPSPFDAIRRLGEMGVYGFEFHDNDIVPVGASAAERDRLLRRAKKVADSVGIRATMASCNLFSHPVFKDGALTSHSAPVRAFALQKTMNAIDMAVEMGAKLFVFWGGREGAEVDASKDPAEAVKRYREAIDFVCEYVLDNGYDMRFAIEPKPNEPRGDIYLATAGSALAFTYTCAHPEMVGVNPEIEHIRMSGLNAYHEIAQLLEAGKLFDIHLGAQKPLRFDQDIRFGAEDLKESFFVVKLIEDYQWDGTRAFDAHPYRTESEEGVWDFVEGCMRSYLILKEKVAAFNADKEIQGLLAEIRGEDPALEGLIAGYSAAAAAKLRRRALNPDRLARKQLRYEKLDQLTQELLLGVR
ncbi:xylose isomerase [candidate division BRC1 bacterium SM23_51]|nr:MAG: xylose isomerase [candidate division BRC1 bacterium SM23_51]